MDTLLNYANKVSAVVQNVEGATEPSVERVEGLPQITIRYNRAQIANYALNIEDINHCKHCLCRRHAGIVYENERQFDLVVRLDSLHRTDIDDLDHLYIPHNKRNTNSIVASGRNKMELGPCTNQPEDGKRRIVIGFNIKAEMFQVS